MKLFVRKAESQKSGKDYYCLILDVGYAEKVLSFDTNLCAELLDQTPRQLVELQHGDYEIKMK